MLLAGLVGLGAAFVLGALHALEPGHGKTVVGAYLVGTRGRAIDAISLGVIVTLAHTSGVLALGIVAVAASAYFVPQQVDRALALVAGLLVLGVGAWLLSEPLRQRRSAHRHDADAGRGHEHHQHHHHVSISTDRPAGAAVAEPPSLSLLLTVGLSGGLIPCPAALAVLLASIATNSVADGVLRVLAFSLGLAAVLIAIGLAMVNAGRTLFRWLPLDAHTHRLRWASGLIIVGLGAYLTVRAAQMFVAA